MKIAVLGGGNGSHAAAVDMTERGHEVWMWRRDQQALQSLVADPTLTVVDERGERQVRLGGASSDLGEVVSGAELVLIPLPATAQPELARALAPHLVDGQVVYLPPGTFGSLVMSDIVRAEGNTADISWAETGTLPWLARKHGEGTVAITVRATRLPTGVYPQRTSEHALGVLRQAFDSIEDCGDALSGALMNAGPIIHPPLILMSAAPLQHYAAHPEQGAWDIHNEGTQPAVRAVTNLLDAERIAVREALGMAAPHFPLADHYDNDRWMYGDAHRKLVDSGDWREQIDLQHHRYMSEDTLTGLAFLVSVAQWAGVEVPVARGLLAIAGAVVGCDPLAGERTMDALGLGGLDRDELAELLQQGRR